MKTFFEYTECLEEAGFTRDQARSQLETMSKIIDRGLVTKPIFENAVQELRFDVEKIRAELMAEIRKAEFQLRLEMKQLESRLTIRLGLINTLALIAIAAFFKYLI